MLRNAGHEISIVDGNALNYTIQDIIQKIEKIQPEILGFNLSTFTFHESLKVIKEIKKATKLPILVGGRHVSYYPFETISQKEIDYALVGECDYSVVDFINILEKKEDLRKVRGLLFKEKNSIIKTKPSDQDFNLDTLPCPAYDLLPLHKYYNFLTRRRNFITMITARGCPFNCYFCGVGNTKARFSSPDKIIRDLYILKRLHVKEIEFYDNSFTLHKKRTREICTKLIKEKLDIEYAIHTRVDLLDDELIGLLSAAGCIRINLGIESANKAILKRLHKSISLEKVKICVKSIKQNKMQVFGYFIMGSPGETQETMQQNLKFAQSLPFDYVQFTRMVAHPGTYLYRMIVKKYKKDFWLEYIQRGKKTDIPLFETNLSINEISRFIEHAYRRFYFRPSQILRVLRTIKSSDQLKRYIKTGIESLVA